MRKLALFTAGAVAVLSIAFVVGWKLFTGYLRSPGGSGRGAKEIVVEVPRNISPEVLATMLHEKRVIERGDWFSWYLTRFRASEKQVVAGEYALRPNMSPIEIMTKLDSGATVTYTITIEPGVRASDAVKLLADNGLARPEELMPLLRDPRVAQELGVASPGLEGFLFPDTYALARALPPKTLLQRMVDRYKKSVPSDVIESGAAIGLKEHELITVASIVEAETVGTSIERAMLSAMLHARLRKKMRLDSHATLAYGLDKRVDDLEPDDYRSPTPYNTFLNDGLPPGPIASPSLAAIIAAARPAKSDVLYLARKSDGTAVPCPDEECFKIATNGVGDPNRPKFLDEPPDVDKGPKRKRNK